MTELMIHDNDDKVVNDDDMRLSSTHQHVYKNYYYHHQQHHHYHQLTREQHVAEHSNGPHITLGIIRSVEYFRSRIVAGAHLLRQLLAW